MNTKVLKNFGKNLKRYRLEKGWTQEQLAEKVNVHQTYIGKLELGLINPSLMKIFVITRALKIKLSNIMDFDYLKYFEKSLLSIL